MIRAQEKRLDEMDPTNRQEAEANREGLLSLAPVGRQTVQEQVYLQLRQAIMAGNFRPGQPLKLRSVAEVLGVSNMPVRAALQRLEAEGAVVSNEKSRTLSLPELDRSELLELCEIRIQLETLAAAHAVKHITPRQLSVAEQHLKLMEAALAAGDTEGYVRESWSFHKSMYEASQMSRLMALIEGLWLRFGPYLNQMFPNPKSMGRAIDLQREAFAALSEGHAKKVRDALTKEIRTGTQTLFKALPDE